MVYSSGLENRQAARSREFESLLLRQVKSPSSDGLFTYKIKLYNTLMQDEKNNQAQAGWVYSPSNESSSAQPQAASSNTPPPASDSAVSWKASEYIAHPKNMNWFVMLGVASIALAVIIYFATSDVTSVVTIMVLAIIIGFFAARQPNALDYSLNGSGVQMGQRFMPYGSFKSFSVVDDGAFSHISLLPLKRFMPPIAIHYAPEDEDKIVNTLADYLPYEEPKRDVIDSISRKVRF